CKLADVAIEWVGPRVIRRQHRAESLAKGGVASGDAGQERRALDGAEFCGLLVELLESVPVDLAHATSPSSLASQARAVRQSRRTVASLMPRVSATSSVVSPPK